MLLTFVEEIFNLLNIYPMFKFSRHTFVFQGFVLYVQILAKKNRLKKELSKCVCD